MARIMSGAAIALLVVLLATTAKASSESTMLAAVDVTFTDPSFTSSNLTFVIEFEGIFGTFCPIVAFSGLLVPTDPPAACMPINNAPANNATKWIAVVMRSDRNCTFYTKAMNAYNAGATAVLIVNDDPTRVVIMSAQENVPIPVISVSLNSGVKIISLVSQSGNTATAAVSVGAELSLFHLVYSRLFFDVAVFFIIFCVVTVLVLGVYYIRRRRQIQAYAQRTRRLQDAAKEAVKSLPMRRYVSTQQHVEGSEGETCAICLDEFIVGVDVKVLPCGHEFHAECICPWLLNHWTCPLCKHNILGEQHELIANGVLDPEVALPAYPVSAVRVQVEPDQRSSINATDGSTGVVLVPLPLSATGSIGIPSALDV